MHQGYMEGQMAKRVQMNWTHAEPSCTDVIFRAFRFSPVNVRANVSTPRRVIRRSDERNVYWSSYGTKLSSKKRLLPFSCGFFWRGRAIRLPKPLVILL